MLFSLEGLKLIAHDLGIADDRSEEFTPADETALANHLSFFYGESVEYNRTALSTQGMLPQSFVDKYEGYKVMVEHQATPIEVPVVEPAIWEALPGSIFSVKHLPVEDFLNGDTQ